MERTKSITTHEGEKFQPALFFPLAGNPLNGVETWPPLPTRRASINCRHCISNLQAANQPLFQVEALSFSGI